MGLRPLQRGCNSGGPLQRQFPPHRHVSLESQQTWHVLKSAESWLLCFPGCMSKEGLSLLQNVEERSDSELAVSYLASNAVQDLLAAVLLAEGFLPHERLKPWWRLWAFPTPSPALTGIFSLSTSEWAGVLTWGFLASHVWMNPKSSLKHISGTINTGGSAELSPKLFEDRFPSKQPYEISCHEAWQCVPRTDCCGWQMLASIPSKWRPRALLCCCQARQLG